MDAQLCRPGSFQNHNPNSEWVGSGSGRMLSQIILMVGQFHRGQDLSTLPGVHASAVSSMTESKCLSTYIFDYIITLCILFLQWEQGEELTVVVLMWVFNMEFWKIVFLILCVYVCAHMCMHAFVVLCMCTCIHAYTYGGQRTTYESQFFPISTWVLKTELRLSIKFGSKQSTKPSHWPDIKHWKSYFISPIMFLFLFISPHWNLVLG